jgi:hypothetical protein
MQTVYVGNKIMVAPCRLYKCHQKEMGISKGKRENENGKIFRDCHKSFDADINTMYMVEKERLRLLVIFSYYQTPCFKQRP